MPKKNVFRFAVAAATTTLALCPSCVTASNKGDRRRTRTFGETNAGAVNAFGDDNARRRRTAQEETDTHVVREETDILSPPQFSPPAVTARSSASCSESVAKGWSDCRSNPSCCHSSGRKCREKNQWWASCKGDGECVPGMTDGYDKWPWSCNVIKPAKSSGTGVIGITWEGNQGATASSTTTTAAAATEPPCTAETNAAQSSSPGGQATYVPGDLTVRKEGLLLSTGLDVRVLARSGQKVTLADGSTSTGAFHMRPDAGECFGISETDASNPGGWVYLNNAEVWESRQGGVGAIEFDKDGNVLGYKMVLTGTTGNCGGGRTPWDTWISCEELTGWGHCYEVDPFQWGPARMTKLSGGAGGAFESAAYDDRYQSQPRFYVTEDTADGALRRYTPQNPDWTNPREMLHGAGTLEYLVLTPNYNDNFQGTYYWTDNKNTARTSAAAHYPYTEGIDVVGNELFFVCKTAKELFILNLDDMTYKKSSTENGALDGDPDQLVRLIGDNANKHHDGEKGILYFTEDLGEDAGVHGRDASGRYFTVFESPCFNEDETTGLAFSPDARHMYVAYQENGILFDIFRTDGRPFTGKKIDIKYHSTMTGRR